MNGAALKLYMCACKTPFNKYVGKYGHKFYVGAQADLSYFTIADVKWETNITHLSGSNIKMSTILVTMASQHLWCNNNNKC